MNQILAIGERSSISVHREILEGHLRITGLLVLKTPLRLLTANGPESLFILELEILTGGFIHAVEETEKLACPSDMTESPIFAKLVFQLNTDEAEGKSSYIIGKLSVQIDQCISRNLLAHLDDGYLSLVLEKHNLLSEGIVLTNTKGLMEDQDENFKQFSHSTLPPWVLEILTLENQEQFKVEVKIKQFILSTGSPPTWVFENFNLDNQAQFKDWYIDKNSQAAQIFQEYSSSAAPKWISFRHERHLRNTIIKLIIDVRTNLLEPDFWMPQIEQKPKISDNQSKIINETKDFDEPDRSKICKRYDLLFFSTKTADPSYLVSEGEDGEYGPLKNGYELRSGTIGTLIRKALDIEKVYSLTLFRNLVESFLFTITVEMARYVFSKPNFLNMRFPVPLKKQPAETWIGELRNLRACLWSDIKRIGFDSIKILITFLIGFWITRGNTLETWIITCAFTLGRWIYSAIEDSKETKQKAPNEIEVLDKWMRLHKLSVIDHHPIEMIEAVKASYAIGHMPDPLLLKLLRRMEAIMEDGGKTCWACERRNNEFS
jgi:hypothetical protein